VHAALRTALLVLPLALPALGARAGRAAEPILDCEPRGRARPVCGFHNPEDLAALPGGAALLVSEFGGMQGERAGGIALLEVASGARRALFRGADAMDRASPDWGDSSCPGAPTEISPHGIDLAPRPDGRLALAVVQHAARESIELFEPIGAGSEWRLAWRGCLVPPEDAWLNDVVWLPDGSLVASSMMPRSQGALAMMRGEGGPGHALHWRPGAGFRELPGTRGALANGVEVSPDGKKLYLNLTRADEVRRVDLATGAVEAKATVLGPDNSTWAPDGRLLVASIRSTGAEDFAACDPLPRGACPIPFAIVALDVATMQGRDLYAGAGPPMGAGTVGLQLGRELFVGSFAGDRVLRVGLDGD
jgi:hypothetical protein